MRRAALGLTLMVAWQSTLLLLCRAQDEGTGVVEIFKSTPQDVRCPENDTVKFNCSVYEGARDILWLVNDTFALGLPPELNVSFKTKSDGSLINSTLEFIAKESVNNSRIVCSVRGNHQPKNAEARLVVTQDINDMNGHHSVLSNSNGAAHIQNWFIGIDYTSNQQNNSQTTETVYNATDTTMPPLILIIACSFV